MTSTLPSTPTTPTLPATPTLDRRKLSGSFGAPAGAKSAGKLPWITGLGGGRGA